MFGPLFHLLGEGWSALIHVLWVATYLVPTWAAAYLFKVTAPQSCPKGYTYEECDNAHFAHVARNNTAYSLFMGLFWPVWLALGGVWLMVRSVDGAVAVTPMPKPKVTLDPAITSGAKTTDELLAEIEGDGSHIDSDGHWHPPNGGTR